VKETKFCQPNHKQCPFYAIGDVGKGS